MLIFLRLILHVFLFLFLTALTQVGGLLYLISILLFRKQRASKKALGFAGVYLLSTFLLVPLLAPMFGREKIRHSEYVGPVSWMTVLCNRNYVDPEWNDILEEAGSIISSESMPYAIQYLDANFPFWNGFPLLPHLSHKDGKKLDLAFIYLKEGVYTSKTPGWWGYGKYEGPKTGETDTNQRCRSAGHWQYDMTKYIGWGWNNNLEFSEEYTSDLVRWLAQHPEVQKIFLEPHLKARMRLTSSKVRFHGCHSVRHDDHIHAQIH